MLFRSDFVTFASAYHLYQNSEYDGLWILLGFLGCSYMYLAKYRKEKIGDTMLELVQSMKVVLATSFSFYLKAHKYHWNVEGPNFSEYHKFLGDLYEEVQDSIDATAEHIRALGEYSPGSYAEFHAFSKISDETGVPVARSMFDNLLSDNQKMIDALNDAFAKAQEANKQGLMNYLADRLDIHAKHGWMLRSITKA